MSRTEKDVAVQDHYSKIQDLQEKLNRKEEVRDEMTLCRHYF